MNKTVKDPIKWFSFCLIPINCCLLNLNKYPLMNWIDISSRSMNQYYQNIISLYKNICVKIIYFPKKNHQHLKFTDIDISS